MPRVEVILFKETDGRVPALDFLVGLNSEAREWCIATLERLEDMGHELRRPVAENLGDGVYELRIKHQRVNYRMLYFFHGRAAVVVVSGFVKQRAKVPMGQIRLALARKRAFEADPATHTFKRRT